MPTFTVSIPDELKRRLKEHPEINWAEYIKGRFETHLGELQRFKGAKKPWQP